MHIFNNLDLISLHFVITTEISLIEGNPESKERISRQVRSVSPLLGNSRLFKSL